jgi:hypothetical protein
MEGVIEPAEWLIIVIAAVILVVVSALESADR